MARARARRATAGNARRVGRYERNSGLLPADRLEEARKPNSRPPCHRSPPGRRRATSPSSSRPTSSSSGRAHLDGPALGLDDAEQALFAQHWLPNYRFRAPPLFTWALVAASGLTDVGMLAISLIRYVLLAMILGFTYLTARRLIRDPSLAALATFSLTAIYVFGYYSHHDLTHTTTLSAFLAASWYVFVRLCETPTLPWYLALGACFGLGMLGKWNFAMFALALPLTCLAHPAYRRLVLDWRIVPAALVAAAIALPSILWALHVGPAPGDNVGGLLGRQGGRSS